MYIDRIEERIDVLLPGADYTVYNSDYSKLYWRDNRPVPTVYDLLQVDVSSLGKSLILPRLWRRLHQLVPNPKCNLVGDNYNSIEWHDERQKPAFVELMCVELPPETIPMPVELKELFDLMEDMAVELKMSDSILIKIGDIKERF